jgi:hypothetical protein
MDNINQKISNLPYFSLIETLKNISITLKHEYNVQIDDSDTRSYLSEMESDQRLSELINQILQENNEQEEVERWGKSLLYFLASDPELSDTVSEAIDDAFESGSKDMVTTSLIILGTIVVLLKWRPKKLKIDKKGINAEWEENDVSIIRDLVKMIGNMNFNNKPGDE